MHSCGTRCRHSRSNDGRTQNDYSGTDKRKWARLMDIRYVFGDDARHSKAHHHTRAYSDAGHRHALYENIGENVARQSAEGHADSELARTRTHRESKNARHAHHAD